MSGKEFDGWCVVGDSEKDGYKNKTDIFTCLISEVIITVFVMLIRQRYFLF